MEEETARASTSPTLEENLYRDSGYASLNGIGARRPCSKVRDKLCVLGRGQPLADHVQNLGHVTRDQSGRVEPEAWKCRTAIIALLVRIETDELAIAKDKPVDLSILHAPDDVFTDT